MISKKINNNYFDVILINYNEIICKCFVATVTLTEQNLITEMTLRPGPIPWLNVQTQVAFS